MNISHIPVIVVTGAADSDMKARLREFGVKTYIQKPFQPEDLLQAVASALAQ